MYTGFRWGNLRERDHLEDPGVYGRVIWRGTLKNEMWGYGLDRSGSGKGQVAGTCEGGNEASGSIKFGELLD